MAIDPFQGVWVATGWNGGGLARLDSVTYNWQHFSNPGFGATRGVAVKLDNDGTGQVTGARVYSAHSETGKVTVIDAVTGQMLPAISVGGGQGPVGVAIDSDGHLWTVNQSSNSATRINTDTNQIMGNYPVGSNPYTYSDMTGYALKTITTVSGDYKHVVKGWESGTTYWESMEVQADLPNDLTTLEVSFRTGNTPTEVKDSDWTGPFGPFPPANFPLAIDQTGLYFEVKITLSSKSLTAFPLLKSFSLKAHKQ